jgi:hypothetical protein
MKTWKNLTLMNNEQERYMNSRAKSPLLLPLGSIYREREVAVFNTSIGGAKNYI